MYAPIRSPTSEIGARPCGAARCQCTGWRRVVWQDAAAAAGARTWVGCGEEACRTRGARSRHRIQREIHDDEEEEEEEEGRQ